MVLTSKCRVVHSERQLLHIAVSCWVWTVCFCYIHFIVHVATRYLGVFHFHMETWERPDELYRCDIHALVVSIIVCTYVSASMRTWTTVSSSFSYGGRENLNTECVTPHIRSYKLAGLTPNLTVTKSTDTNIIEFVIATVVFVDVCLFGELSGSRGFDSW